MTTSIFEYLESHKIRYEAFEGTWNASFGEGLNENKINFALPDGFETKGPVYQRAFARGIRSLVSEPARSPARKYSFEQAAGVLFPVLEHQGFVDAFKHAGEEALTVTSTDRLAFVFVIETDRGRRVLPLQQFQKWGVKLGRVEAAARSMLFHRTRGLEWNHFDGQVFSLRAGDGLDSARGIVFQDAFFGDTSENFRIAIPSTDHFLFIKDESSIDALKAAALSVYESANAPLTPAIFALHGDGLREAEH